MWLGWVNVTLQFEDGLYTYCSFLHKLLDLISPRTIWFIFRNLLATSFKKDKLGVWAVKYYSCKICQVLRISCITRQNHGNISLCGCIFKGLCKNDQNANYPNFIKTTRFQLWTNHAYHWNGFYFFRFVSLHACVFTTVALMYWCTESYNFCIGSAGVRWLGILSNVCNIICTVWSDQSILENRIKQWFQTSLWKFGKH